MRYGRDPLWILLKQESYTCKGCVHEMKQKVVDSSISYCGLSKNYGKRCNKYQERTA